MAALTSQASEIIDASGAVAANLDWASSHVSHNAHESVNLNSAALSDLQCFIEDSSAEIPPVVGFLRTVPHFYMLGAPQLRVMAASMLRREFGRGEMILHHTQSVKHVYVALQGSIDAFLKVPSCGHNDPVLEDRVATIHGGNVFAFDCVVTDTKSKFNFRAGAALTEVGLVPAEVFFKIIGGSVQAAQSIGRKMAEHMDIFRVIKEFCRLIFSHDAVKYEYLPVTQILDNYSRLHNGIHPKASLPEVDVGAWLYAIRRLPDNVTTTFCYDLARALPPFVASRLKRVAKEVDVGVVHSMDNQATSGLGADNNSSSLGEVKFIKTAARRRCCWQIGLEGKAVVLLRDGFTDVLDFVSCLCVHIFEANKLRARLNGVVNPPAIDLLDEALFGSNRTTPPSENTPPMTPVTPALPVSHAEVMHRLPLSDGERRGIEAIWGPQMLRRMYEVFIHREEYMLRIDSSVARRFQTDPFHEWALGIRSVILRKLKLNDMSPLPNDLVLDVMSSNTHCTKNCLSPWPRIYREEILAFGKEHRPEIVDLAWNNEEDLIYYLTPHFIDCHPEAKADWSKQLKQAGVEVMEDTALTGLQVDIIPVEGLRNEMLDRALVGANHTPVATPLASAQGPGTTPAKQYQEVDGPPLNSPNLAAAARQGTMEGIGGDSVGSDMWMNQPNESFMCIIPPERHFIINMDYAFGAQADGITKALVTVFGHRIRSFSVMGKAGGLVGGRGDIQLPTHVLQSKSSLTTDDCLDELRSCGNQDVTADRLAELCPDRPVHKGPVLTIAGTLLQNAPMLNYYRNIWGCVGVEMEGSHFARQLRECRKIGLVSRELKTRFAYYTSDLPLETGAATLAKPMLPTEGAPACYAITRAFLEQMLRPAQMEI